jgi:hypothetical protein
VRDPFGSTAKWKRAREEHALLYGRITNEQPRPGHPGEFIADLVPPPEQLGLFDLLGDGRRPGQLRLFRDPREWRKSGERVAEAECIDDRYIPRPPSLSTHVLERRISPPGAYYKTYAGALAIHPAAIPAGWRIVSLGEHLYIERPRRPSDAPTRVLD